jgi:hypothetical protein
MIPLPVWLSPTALMLMAAVGASCYGAGRVQQYYNDREDHRVEMLEAQIAADKVTNDLEAKHKLTAGVLQDELNTANARSVALADELRKRPDRLPPAARAACKGSTGAELSGRDAAAFARLGDRARLLQLELAACYKREEDNYEALKRAK